MFLNITVRTSHHPIIHFYLVPRLRTRGVLSPLPPYAFTAWCLGTGTAFRISLSSSECMCWHCRGWMDARRKRQNKRRTRAEVAKRCVCTDSIPCRVNKALAFVWLPFEFIRTSAGGSNATDTTASFGEMRNAYRILDGKPEEKKTFGINPSILNIATGQNRLWN
jgi:hypothetical protein